MMQKPGILAARRLALLAGAAGLSATLMLGGANFVPNAAGLGAPGAAWAQGAQRPVGFADIVEKVKPAVISVRVKVDGGSRSSGLSRRDLPPGFEQFFRRFGMPDIQPDEPRGNRRNFVTGQGSGFFISADGY